MCMCISLQIASNIFLEGGEVSRYKFQELTNSAFLFQETFAFCYDGVACIRSTSALKTTKKDEQNTRNS